MCKNDIPPAPGQPGPFHRLTGIPFTYMLHPQDYKDKLAKDYDACIARKNDLNERLVKSEKKVEKYQTSLREHQNAFAWGFGKAVLMGLNDSFLSDGFFGDFAMMDQNTNTVEVIAKARKDQKRARNAAPHKLPAWQNTHANERAEYAKNEAHLKQLSNQLQLAGGKSNQPVRHLGYFPKHIKPDGV